MAKINKSSEEYLRKQKRDREKANKPKKERAEKKRHSTGSINRELALKHYYEEKRKAQQTYLIYFIHEINGSYKILAEVYADSPDQINEASEQLGERLDNLEKKLTDREAAFAIHDFDREVTKICSSHNFFGIELNADTFPRTLEGQEYHIPVLYIQGTYGKLQTLSNLLEDFKYKRTQRLDLCSQEESTSPPDQIQ